MGIKSLAKQVLTEQQNKRYRRLLSEKCVSYADWVAEQERAGWGLKECAGEADYMLLCFGNGEIAKNAKKNIARYLKSNRDVEMLYGDEDVRDVTGSRRSPWFKPDWSPDLLDSQFYFGSLVAVRTALWDKVEKELWNTDRWKDFPIPQADEDLIVLEDVVNYMALVRKCVEFAGGYTKNCKSIGHFPGILYHVKEETDWEKFLTAGVPDVDTFAGAPLLSVIIPSKDNPDILQKCLASCRAMEYPAMEIIVVDNGSSEENRKRIEEMILAMNKWSNPAEKNGMGDVRYLYHPMEFNFSQMCNMGARMATGELYLFLNDDVELQQTDCLRKMAARALRSYTGAVGLKLFYPDSRKIQHAGITNLPMGPVHKLQFKEDNKSYYFGANCGCRNFLAVTAACLMVEKRKFEEVGGFCEEMRVAFNDVDFCFALYEAGYVNICVNDCFAYHHESLSRGEDESREKLERLLSERKKLYERHPKLEGKDPYYSMYLNQRSLDTSIRPGYEAGRETSQIVLGSGEVSGQEKARAVSKKDGLFQVHETFRVEKYRQDDCLLLRVEDARHRKMVGYAVVLGDNNACYEKTLLLKRETSEGDSQPVTMYAVPMVGTYRADLAENMPDQENIALSGFDVQLQGGAVPAGNYLVGVAARNRVTGMKLINWSNRVVEL